MPPALTREEQTRRIGKTPVLFGPSLAHLPEGQRNNTEISGRLNRATERYLALLHRHGLELSEPERQCIAQTCGVGYMSTQEIRALSMEAQLTAFECQGPGGPTPPGSGVQHALVYCDHGFLRRFAAHRAARGRTPGLLRWTMFRHTPLSCQSVRSPAKLTGFTFGMNALTHCFISQMFI